MKGAFICIPKKNPKNTGSGKSSLLNALAGRVAFVKGARLEGDICLNGAAVDYAVLPRLCGACGGGSAGRQAGSGYMVIYGLWLCVPSCLKCAVRGEMLAGGTHSP